MNYNIESKDTPLTECEVKLIYPGMNSILIGGMGKAEARNGINWLLDKDAHSDTIAKYLSPKQFSNQSVLAIKQGCVSEYAGGGDLSCNTVIKADNLIALHTLKNSLKGAVDLVYIDPPYFFESGGSADSFCYNSNFKLSSWLVFMKNRLEVARTLLAPSGFIAISISEEGRSHLKLLCDDIFSSANCVGAVTWEAKTKSQNTTSAKFQLQQKTESILIYKNFKEKPVFSLEKTGVKEYPLTDEKGSYRLKLIGQMSALGMRGRISMVFSIKGIVPRTGNQWQLGAQTVHEYESRGDLTVENGKAFIKQRPTDEDANVYQPFWSHFFDKETYGTSESGKKLLSSLMGEKTDFESVKPVPLITKLIKHLCGTKDVLVLDFFAGSGTTGHAVMELNKEDGGARRFILIEQMDYAKSLTLERLKRAAVKEDYDTEINYAEIYQNPYVSDVLKALDIAELLLIVDQLVTNGALKKNVDVELLKDAVRKSKSLKNSKKFIVEQAIRPESLYET